MSRSDIEAEVRDEAREMIFQKRFQQEVQRKLNTKISQGKDTYQHVDQLNGKDDSALVY